MEHYIKKVEAGQVTQAFWDNLAQNVQGFQENKFESELFDVLVAELERRAGIKKT